MAKVTIQKLDEAAIEKQGIRQWPIWTKEVSRFDWSYDENEECLILEGEFSVETDEGTFRVKAGDFVTFAKGLRCVWNITRPVRKHYHFY
jgi:uncharacterized cupin superfamily protein